MVRGLYAAASGMLTIQEQTATTASNLANVDTTGFKADMLRFTSAPAVHTWRVDDPTTTDKQGRPRPEYIGLTNAGVMDTEIWRDFSQGQIVETRRPLDVALIGDGFLRVKNETGQEMYTRDGELRQTPDGFLTDERGRRVQGLGGDINVGSSNDVSIDRSGGVYADGAQVDTLSLAHFSDPQTQLAKAGDNLWSASSAPDGTGASEVQSGFIERSNVSAVDSLTELIMQLRHYEAAQRVIVAEDGMLNIAANNIGRMPQ
jgi:flagellar basal-body rod protein FlgF